MFTKLSVLSSKGSLKSRLLSFRDRFRESETNMVAVATAGKISERNGCRLAVEELRDEIRRTLKELMRMMRSESGCFLNPDVDDVGSAQIYDDVERDYVMLWAAFLGRLDALQQLRADGAHLNAEHPTERYNALHLAALSGNLECVRWLLNEGCPIRYTVGGLSPLHFAAFGGALHVCQFLLCNECPINSTALHAAVYSGSIDCVRFLLADRRVSLREYDDGGLTALHVAADLGDPQMVELLLDNDRVDVNAKTRTTSSYTALHTAAENGYVDCMRSLLRAGADVNAKSAHLRTPLHLACKLAFVDCVQLLLENKADVNVQDEDGRTPLHVSVSKSPWSMPLVRLLVEHEANVNVSDSFGYTVLHVAALNELEVCVEYLILNGANVAARTAGNITALNIINRKTPVSVKMIPARLNQFLSYKEQNLKLNFRDIIHNSTVGEIGFLYTLQKEGQENVLVHPLIQAFLYRKWQKVKYYIVFRVVFSILTAILLSSYVLLCITKGVAIAVPFKQLLDVCGNETTVGNCIEKKCNISGSIEVKDCAVNITNDLSDRFFIEAYCVAGCKDNKTVTLQFHKQTGHQTLIEQCWCSTLLSCSIADSVDEYKGCVNDSLCNFLLEHPPVIDFSWRLINVLIGLNAVRIGFSTAGYKSAKHYLSYYVNILELFVTFSTVTLSFIDQDSIEIRLPIGACAVLSYWAFLMITVGHLPFFGTHVAMFLKVLKEFLRMIGAFFCLLIGFTFTFCVLKPKRFESPLSGFIKIIGMMTGELNTDEVIEVDMVTTPVAKSTLEYTLIFVLWLFMFLVTIVLMNLLVGIAVNDVEGLRKTADLCELIQQTKLIYFIELCCFRGYFPKRMVKCLRKWLYTSPDSYKVVMYVRPLNPHEKRLPKDVMDAAVVVAVERTSSRYKTNNSKKTIALDKRVENMEIELKKLVELVCKLNENIDLLTVTGEKPENDPIWSKTLDPMSEELTYDTD